MDESILYSVKTYLGPNAEDPHFDAEIIPLINKEFWKLWTLGVGPSVPFRIEDASSIWSDFTDNIKMLDPVQTCVCHGVKLTFDPPTQTSHLQALKDDYKELQCRLEMEFDKT